MQRQPPRSIFVILFVRRPNACFMSVEDCIDSLRKRPELQSEDCVLQALLAMRQTIRGLPLAVIDQILSVPPRGYTGQPCGARFRRAPSEVEPKIIASTQEN